MKRFTLLELLVVVAIIGILASILLPSVSKARASAKRAQCTNNLKQVAIAMEIYVMDHEDYYPPAFTWAGNASFDDLMSSYVGYDLTSDQIDEKPLTSYTFGGGETIFQCPEDNLSRDAGEKRSYSLNGGNPYDTAGYQGLGNEAGGSVTVNQITNTSNTIQLGERFVSNNSIGSNQSAILGNVASHLGKAVHGKSDFFVFSFCDGSVRYLNKEIAKNKQNR